MPPALCSNLNRGRRCLHPFAGTLDGTGLVCTKLSLPWKSSCTTRCYSDAANHYLLVFGALGLRAVNSTVLNANVGDCHRTVRSTIQNTLRITLQHGLGSSMDALGSEPSRILYDDKVHTEVADE